MSSAEKYREKALQILINKIESWIIMYSEKGSFEYVWNIPIDISKLIVSKIEFEKRGFDVKRIMNILIISWS